MSPDSVPRWQRRRDARPAELLDAAAECFGRNGYLATRVEEIAARAGVTVGTVYRYYPNKEALFGAVLEESRKSLPSGWGGAERDPARLLRETLERWWAFLSDPGQSMLLRATLAGSADVPEAAAGYARDVRARLEQQLGGVLRLGMAAGSFRSVDVPSVARALADTLLGGTIAMPTIPRTPSLERDSAAYLMSVFGTAMHGIVNRAPVPAPQTRPDASAPARGARPVTRGETW
jgi:AcrR family transcriptional regulator